MLDEKPEWCTRSLRLFVLLGLLFSSLPFSVSTTSAALLRAPNLLNLPENVACRAHGGNPDTLRVSWKDTNANAADYKVYRQEVGSATWNEVGTVTDPDKNGNWLLVDADASGAIYRYSVTAIDGNEETTRGGANETCREPLFLDSNAGGYRLFYRLEECPPYDGKQVCTEDLVLNGQNKHVAQILQNSEDYRNEFIALNFDDPAIFSGAPYFPLDFFPCNNGCANGDGVQYPPKNFEGIDYDPVTGNGSDYEVFIAGHEIFHKVQSSYGGAGGDPYYKWVMEGQARASEDKTCVFPNATHCFTWDTKVKKYWLGQVQSYLGAPEQSLMEASYNAALFWGYVMEQFSTTQVEPQYGMDVLLQYWEQNRLNVNAYPQTKGKDGIETLNDTLELKIGTDRRFEDVFEDFAVANYAKDLITNPVSDELKRYNYIDEEQCATCNYGMVKRTISETLGLDDSIFGTTGMDAWGARYFEVALDSSVPAVHIEVEPLAVTPHELYYHVLAIKNGAIVKQWVDEGKSFALTVPTIDPYDRLALIVVSHEHKVNFDYGFNLMDGVFINGPTNQRPAQVGEETAPRKFMLQLSVLGKDEQPVAGIDTSQFTITVGSTQIHPPANPADNAIIASTYVGGQYWLVLRAPTTPGCSECDLTVQYADYTDSEAAAIRYGPVPDVDNQIIIDRSGSMIGEKIVAAKDAAKIYVDSYNTGDRVGVISFNQQPTSEFALTGWTETSRQQAQSAITNMAAPIGDTAIGAALRLGMEQLINQASPNPAWAMVLLSDGMDSVNDTNDHIPAFLSEYGDRKKSGAQIPVIHSIAIGDDADGVALEKAAQVSGGLFQWLPESSGLMAANASAINAAPLQLGLAEIYRVFAETVMGEQQIYAATDVINDAKSKTHFVQVDGGASEAIFSVAYQYIEFGIPINVRIFRPDNTQLGPPTLVASNHHLWRVPAPQAGQWRVEVSPVIPGAMAASEAAAPTASQTNFLVEAAVQSDLVINGFLGLPPDMRIAGKAMPLVVLLADVAAISGATVQATVERTGETLTLFDDGLHGDGAAGDGFYGGLIKNTHQPGGYSVVVDAQGISPLLGEFDRRARLSFFMADTPDSDNDGLPDWWENEHSCLKPNALDRADDPDQDGLNNAAEFAHQTNPCDPDTDDGGENDGSEVKRGADPLMPADDGTRPPRGKAWPSVGKVILTFSAPVTGTVEILRGTAPEGPFTPIVAELPADEHSYEDTTVNNGTRYCYQLVAKDTTVSAPSDITCTTPNDDPHPPHGVVEPRRPVEEPAPRTILLYLDASDDPEQEEHMPFDGELLTSEAVESGVVDMRISNRADFVDTDWEPYQEEKLWTFVPDENHNGTVFVQYRDAAGNVSDVVALTLLLGDAEQEAQSIFLPLIQR